MNVLTAAPTTASPALSAAPNDIRAVAWHRPPLILATVMVLLILVSAIGMLVDTREVTGVNLWTKPFKFAVSTAIYSVTLSWLVGLLHRGSRVARVASTVATVALAIELIIITAFAAIGETSHFNATTPLHTAAWAVMAMSISVVWVMTLVLAVLLFRAPLGDRARTLAIRAGLVIALLGMALGFLMTGPNSAQLADYQGIAGAHTVGIPDGGPGLPLLGWSTVAGDLRIPHFLGMHALQALPILVILLELASRRIHVLRDVAVRLRLIAIAAIAILATIGVVTVQALSGESIVHPSTPFLVAGAAIVIFGAALVSLILARGRRVADPSGQPATSM